MVFMVRQSNSIWGSSERDEPRNFNKTMQIEILKRQHNKCAMCKKKLELDAIHFDHIVPFKDGGKTTIKNGQALCPNCHAKKSHKDRLKQQSKRKKKDHTYLFGFRVD